MLISKKKKIFTLNLAYTIPCHCPKMSDFAQIFSIAARKILVSPNRISCHCPKNSDFAQIFETWVGNFFPAGTNMKYMNTQLRIELEPTKKLCSIKLALIVR